MNPYFSVTDRKFIQAYNSVPESDIEYLKQWGKESDDILKRQLLIVRYTNPICENCLKKPPSVELNRCGRCYIAMYCSRECQKKHWEKHKYRCCKRTAPLDDGPMRFAVLPVENKKS